MDSINGPISEENLKELFKENKMISGEMTSLFLQLDLLSQMFMPLQTYEMAGEAAKDAYEKEKQKILSLLKEDKRNNMGLQELLRVTDSLRNLTATRLLEAKKKINKGEKPFITGGSVKPILEKVYSVFTDQSASFQCRRTLEEAAKTMGLGELKKS